MTLAPGSTIGIVGGGQLGRMMAIAAAQLGYRCHIFAPEGEAPAIDVAAAATRAAYDDRDALARFAAAVDVVTYEFENIDAAPLAALAEQALVRPSVRALEVTQDRLFEKSFAAGQGGRPAPYRPVDCLEDLRAAIDALGTPAILKTRRMGYDGKGQARIASSDDAGAAWDAIGRRPAVLEAMVSFEAEFSILLARGADGATVAYDAPDNSHVGGILATSTLPARPIVAAQRDEAVALAEQIAAALDYVGVLTLEYFATADGPVLNEMAPRVHNSGHWTIEGAVTSQFENHVRAICGLPLGSAERVRPHVEMRNLIGEDAHAWREILSDPAAHLHLYGKAEARAGRKMGHVTRIW
ncbi:5-(carboxyamino)imidazole ribonucleotide synthase [Flavisphingomonas formosensis]|uniref:5-(carboxyamino)imidazole ribonucleotide synthase n=1 Tax=Flavisphingomonas formosensis TaxID=861534 RepID=UPI0012F7399E|nr:5-(carboxyamino)imidazole ribonucleotide synthase [Sphingomonas formosensis]